VRGAEEAFDGVTVRPGLTHRTVFEEVEDGSAGVVEYNDPQVRLLLPASKEQAAGVVQEGHVAQQDCGFLPAAERYARGGGDGAVNPGEAAVGVNGGGRFRGWQACQIDVADSVGRAQQQLAPGVLPHQRPDGRSGGGRFLG
jgi:hypothetical protein